MSKGAADTLGWPFLLLWLQGMMAVEVTVQQDLGGGCPHNLGKGKKHVSVIYYWLLYYYRTISHLVKYNVFELCTNSFLAALNLYILKNTSVDIP